jgi:hypothetical protein
MGETQVDTQWRTLSVTTGVAGIAGLVLVMVSQLLQQVGGSEPAFDASGDEILRFFQARNDTLYAIGTFLGLIAAVSLAVFVSALWAILREIEERPAFRSAIALISGITFVALLMSPGWELAGFRVDEGVDPQLARYAFDMGNLGFANSWVALAAFLFAVGWIILISAALPRWLGWLGLVAGVGFLLGRAFWTTPIWLIPYTLFWIWVIAISIHLLRGKLIVTRLPARGGSS